MQFITAKTRKNINLIIKTDNLFCFCFLCPKQ